jgi:hypothetical protein
MAEDPTSRLTRADAFLRQTSWDGTWSRMRRLIDSVVRRDGADPVSDDRTRAAAG